MWFIVCHALNVHRQCTLGRLDTRWRNILESTAEMSATGEMTSCTCPLQPSQLNTGGHEGCCIECRLSQPGMHFWMIFFKKNGTVGPSGLNQVFIFM